MTQWLITINGFLYQLQKYVGQNAVGHNLEQVTTKVWFTKCSGKQPRSKCYILECSKISLTCR